MPKHPSPQNDSMQQYHRSTFSKRKEHNSNIYALPKQAHNLVEKRYRENMSARFKQLDDVTKQEAATTGTDAKVAMV
jgi:hypothetical protein